MFPHRKDRQSALDYKGDIELRLIAVTRISTFVLCMDSVQCSDICRQEMSEDTALEQAKNAKGRAAAILVEQAISNSYVFHFAELLEHENIIALAANPETKPWNDMLHIFAYGTYADYVNNMGSLPKLDESQKLKLKQLTIITLANQNKVERRPVEDCIIEGMYSGLFKGKLDQKKQEFQ
eukprot:338979-Hanusia_phi.AAC.1